MADSSQLNRIDPALVVQMLESLQRAGVTDLPAGESVPVLKLAAALPPDEGQTPVNESSGPNRSETPPYQRSNPPASMLDQETLLAPTSASQPSFPESHLIGTDSRQALHLVQQEVSQCVRCQELATTRTQTVFGVGNPDARLVMLGEAPGADEDRKGEPFVGAAGQLLDRILDACTLSRDEVYILNTLKCRPPGNRNPSDSELTNCRGFLERQLAIIQPETICCLGGVAAKALLNSTLSVGRLRGSFHDYQGIKVMVTYHPAYLLRNPDAKRQVWEDMKWLMAEMGIELPRK